MANVTSFAVRDTITIEGQQANDPGFYQMVIDAQWKSPDNYTATMKYS